MLPASAEGPVRADGQLVEYDSMIEGDSQSGTVYLQKCL